MKSPNKNEIATISKADISFIHMISLEFQQPPYFCPDLPVL